MLVKLKDIADVIISNVDKKIKENEKKVYLCNFTDVYNNYAITKKGNINFMMASASKSQIDKFSIKKGYLAITKDSETRDDIGVGTFFADNFDNLLLGYHCALIKPNASLVNSKFLNAYIQSPFARKYYELNASGSGQRYTLTIDTIANTPIYLPAYDVQLKIGNLLSEIDKQIERNNAVVKRLQVLGKTIYSKKITNCLFDKMSLNAVITTGKEDANHAKINGKYKFFTCGDNSLMCDDFKFEGKSVLVAGNGNFNVKYYDGKFNAYQRTYIVKNDKIIGNLYYTLLFNTELFRKKSNGSIIKFITIDMLNKIDVPIFSNEINNALNKILSKINEIQSNIFKLNNFKEILIPILINGQLQ